MAAALLAIITYGQNQSQDQTRAHGVRRPRIGLVLEGGGALGLAHIGVIQWLEEHHIPVR
jgi:NTE family protein